MNFSILTPRLGRVLSSEAAPLLADARLYGAQALGVGVARDHAGLVEIAPDGGKIFLLHAEEIDALSAGHLDGRDLELVGHVGDGAQLVGGGQPAPHARHDGVGSVLLDIGMHALVDVARLAVVLVFAGPGGQHVVVECRPALGAAARGLPFERLHEMGNGFQLFGDDEPAHVVVAELGARAHRQHGSGGYSLRRGSPSSAARRGPCMIRTRPRLWCGRERRRGWSAPGP